MIRYLRWGAVAFLVFFIATQPSRAAAVASGLVSDLGAVASGFAAFLGQVV